MRGFSNGREAHNAIKYSQKQHLVNLKNAALRVKVCIVNIAGSSNGRTVAFGAIYFGSSPNPAANLSRVTRYGIHNL